MASWRYNPASRRFLTLDSPRWIAAKRDSVREQGLGGLMFWGLNADSEDYALLNAMTGG